MAGVEALGFEAEVAPSWAIRSPFPQFFFPMSTALLILLQVVIGRSGYIR